MLRRRGWILVVLMLASLLASCKFLEAIGLERSPMMSCEDDGGIWVEEASDGTPLEEPYCDHQYDDPLYSGLDEAGENGALALDTESFQIESAGIPWTVRLIPMDVRDAARPPDTIAYANVEHSPPPEGVAIYSVDDLWTYNANIALMEEGDWIEAVCSGSDVTAVGVHLGGDSNDGWVRALVDGVEVWRGSIYGDPDSAEGVYIRYLEISGLEPGTHTIRLENLGIDGEGGGDDVAMRFFGCSTLPVGLAP